jgi:hypothetical protein
VSPATTAKVTATPKDAKNATAAAAKKKDLLGETAMGNKEQRKADWAIMKEMAKYLWPKVGEFLGHGVCDYLELSLTGYHTGRLGDQAPCWNCLITLDWSEGV